MTRIAIVMPVRIVAEPGTEVAGGEPVAWLDDAG
jgi:hypothetical protein